VSKNIERTVMKIINQVRTKGDSAVIYFTKKFDRVNITRKNMAVKNREIKSAYSKVSRDFVKAIRKAYSNIWQYHLSQMPQARVQKIKNKILGEIYTPINRVGIYVPGGKYSYPSTVLMATIPARIAGVKEIVIATPAKNLTPEVLVTADLCGVKEIYRIGGVQAIAALAYGTESVRPVDKIVGPGNIYVTLAKKILFGEVGIDMLAGPSEIVILADDSANKDFVFYDLLAQAEHDTQAKAILLSINRGLVEEIRKKIPKKFKTQIQLVKVANLNQGIRYINLLAPEHLVLALKDYEKVLPRIRNAGAIFLGNYSPVAIGDYIAGPSHILPTGRTARFCSGLSVYDFVKRIGIIGYTASVLKKELPYASTLAKTEGLNYHFQSLKIRES